MSEQPHILELMFRHAQRLSLEDFTDEDLEKKALMFHLFLAMKKMKY